MRSKGRLAVWLMALIFLGLVVGVLAADPETEKAQQPPPPKAKPAKDKKLTLPKEYGSWVHVKTMVILEKHPLYNLFGGIHHVYINRKGQAALETGKSYPEGTVFIFDLYEAKLDNGAYVEGPRKLTAIMKKNTAAFSETGGWGFEMFAGPKREPQVKDAKKECFECHLKTKERDYVYSQPRK